MPRSYGLFEIQRIVETAYERGWLDREAGKDAKAPSATKVLSEIGIRHPMNRSFKLGQLAKDNSNE